MRPTETTLSLSSASSRQNAGSPKPATGPQMVRRAVRSLHRRNRKYARDRAIPLLCERYVITVAAAGLRGLQMGVEPMVRTDRPRAAQIGPCRWVTSLPQRDVQDA